MNRITQLFESCKQGGILSVYFTAGYPALHDTKPILEALESRGVHMAEIGIPFSDPLADGPVIQQSSAQALRNGMSLRLLFRQLRDIRRTVNIPLILMGYLNPVMQYGFEAFCRACTDAGIDGIIIPDLPFDDYTASYKATAERHGLKIIMLVTPETPDARIRLIDRHTGGFIYAVSSASVTGAQKEFDENSQAFFRRIRAMHLRNPHLIGFGVGNKATYDAALAHAHGAIIGSRFVGLLQQSASPEEAVDRLLRAITV
ncbi:MAG: tryptophan synthase subunit alpha [Tannerella sp.]|jgi:tryptophan synthase alpha chain|nr:tryptophan synthase subunit alpha [Tannerella sp.]